MNNLRSEFEELPEVAKKLVNNGGGYYRKHANDYHHCNHYIEKYLNGSWYAFQEQQKKIEAVLGLFVGYECGPELGIFREKIEELLK